MIFLVKLWSWLKRNWKIVFFPVGALMFIGGVLIAIMSKDEEQSPDFGEDGEDLAEKLVGATAERDTRLQQLKEQNQRRLEQLNNDQKRELEELKDKPLEEVVAWFDKL